MSPTSPKYSRPLSILTILALLLSFPALGAPDGGWDVELLDAGTTLSAPMAVMTPGDAQNLDQYLRTTEKDRDGYKAVVLIAVPVGVLAVVVAIVEGVALATKR